MRHLLLAGVTLIVAVPLFARSPQLRKLGPIYVQTKNPWVGAPFRLSITSGCGQLAKTAATAKVALDVDYVLRLPTASNRGEAKVTAELIRGNTVLWAGDSLDWPLGVMEDPQDVLGNLAAGLAGRFVAHYRVCRPKPQAARHEFVFLPGSSIFVDDQQDGPTVAAQLKMDGYHVVGSVKRADVSLLYVTTRGAYSEKNDYHVNCYSAGDIGWCSDNLGNRTDWGYGTSSTTITDNTDLGSTYHAAKRSWELFDHNGDRIDNWSDEKNADAKQIEKLLAHKLH